MHYGSAPYVFRGWVSVWRSGLSYACDLKPPWLERGRDSQAGKEKELDVIQPGNKPGSNLQQLLMHIVRTSQCAGKSTRMHS